jgi:peptide/nickel transport system substrate-binding protein
MVRSSKLWLLLIVFILIVTAIIVTGCGQGKVETDQHIDAFVLPAEVVLAAPRDLAPGPQDPYYTSSILMVWEPLFAVNEQGEPTPRLVKTWTMSEDGREWIFVLKQEVVFHDGLPFNAEAVIANFERYRKISPKGSPFYSFNVNEIYPGLIEVSKVDDYTVKMSFEQPVPTLIYNMISFGSAMFSPNNFAADGNFNGLPMGTGPFKLVDHEKDQYALLEAFEGYHGDKAKAETIRVRVIPNPDTRLSALKAEEIMGVMDLGALQPSLAKELLKDERFVVSTAKSTITHYLTPNGNKPPFNDPRMKQAVSLLIDRELIVKELYEGYPVASGNILNYTSPFAKDIKAKHDKEMAKALANEALGGAGQTIDLIIPTWGLERYPYKAQAEYIQALLGEIGLEAKISILDGAAFRNALSEGEFNLAMNIQGLPNGEPFIILDRFMSSNGATNKSYNLGYSSQRADQLAEELKTTLDMNERSKKYLELQEISAQELPTIPLFNDTNIIAFNKKIKGYKATLYGTTLSQLEWAK